MTKKGKKEEALKNLEIALKMSEEQGNENYTKNHYQRD